jgi:hypothetical protein
VSDPRKGCPPDPDDMVCMACGAVACPHQAGEMDRHHAAGFRAGVEACVKHLREKCAGTWSVNDVANELVAMKEKMDAIP